MVTLRDALIGYTTPHFRRLALYRFLYDGGWLREIVDYLDRQHKISPNHFFERLTQFVDQNPATLILSKLANGTFLRYGNSRNLDEYVGPYNPHGGDWSKGFDPYKYVFLCVRECKENFWNEIDRFFQEYERGIYRNEIRALTSYRRTPIVPESIGD